MIFAELTSNLTENKDYKIPFVFRPPLIKHNSVNQGDLERNLDQPDPVRLLSLFLMKLPAK